MAKVIGSHWSVAGTYREARFPSGYEGEKKKRTFIL